LKIPNITAALALSLAVAIPAVAQSDPAEDAKRIETVDKWFTQYDRNRDGKVTVDEYSMGKSYFAALDANKDGILTREEAKAALTPRKRAMDWKKMDTDKDGYVTVREWTGTSAEFDEHDLDNDRVLSRYDRDLGREMSRAENRLEAFDADRDGFVSRQEWPADEATFQKRDRNHDGKLTVEELMEDVKKKG
jgi:Ca2+-binding EF-hand superfamily protein